MSDEVEAVGEAFDPVIDTSPSSTANVDLRAEAERAVAGAQTKVERLRENLAFAEQTLADREAELAAFEGGE